VTIAFLTGCEPTRLSIETPSSAAATLSTPVPGIQYYCSQNAKYLGSDNSDSTGYRLIDGAIFSNIVQNANGVIDKQAARQLYDSSLPITIDNQQIQSDCQFIRDSSLAYKVEYPLYIFLDRNTGGISCIRERPGTNTRSPVEVIPSRRYGVTYPKIGSTAPDSRILIAQVISTAPIPTRNLVTQPISPSYPISPRSLIKRPILSVFILAILEFRQSAYARSRY
jgi:hypothetical protein